MCLCVNVCVCECVCVCVNVCVPEETQGFLADCTNITVFTNSGWKMQQVPETLVASYSVRGFVSRTA